MQPVELLAVAEVDAAIALASAPDAIYLAGGTNVVDLLRTGAITADTLVDIDALPLRQVEAGPDGLRIGALARMSDVAAQPVVRDRFRFIAEALELSASAQLRNMASIGGNLLQRTRCSYFRERDFPCNKRAPGSGCAAIDGDNRRHAILGGSDDCVATHASDLAVALIAADAQVRLHGRNASRTVALFDLYVEPSATPQIETVVEPGELIAEVVVPPLPGGEASRYLKLRERASYEFALVSVAAAVVLAEGTITSARIGVGGVATKPWRARETEDALIGVEIENVTALERAAAAALADARPLRDNGFKVELARRAIMRAVRQAAGVA